MRILLLTDRLDARGGAIAYWTELLTALSERHDVQVAAGQGSPERLPRWPEGVPAIRVRALAEAGAGEGDLAGLEPLFSRADVIHVQNLMSPRALQLAVDTGKAIVTVQDHRLFCPGPGRTLPDGSRCTAPFQRADCAACLPEDDYRQRMLTLTAARLEATRGARITVLSSYMAEELALVGLRGARVLPPPVRPGPPRSAPGSGFLLAGRLVSHKGVDLGVEAWRRAGVSAPLRLAGAGRLAEAPGVQCLGWLDPSALRAELRAARALLFPTRWQEPLGMLGLEALAEGTPVVAMDVGGVRDWAGAGVRLVPPGDVDAMAAAICDLDADAPGALALGEQGRRALSRFDPARFRQDWEDLLREVAG